MTESAAQKVLETYQRDLGQPTAHTVHRDFQLKGREQQRIQIANGYLLLLFSDDDVVITSDLGVYDRLSEGVSECQHVHSGEVVLQNFSDTLKNVECYQCLMD